MTGSPAAPVAAGVRGQRWLLASGAAFALTQLAVLVYFGVTVISKFPPVGAPAAERIAMYVENWDQIRLGNFLLPLPTPLFLLFLGAMYTGLRRAERGTGVLSATAFGGGIATALVWPIGMVIGALAMEVGRNGGDAVTMSVLEGFAPLSLALSAMPRAVMVGAAAAVILSGRGRTPRWIGWMGALLAPLCVAGTATLLTPAAFPIAALGMLLFLVWILALSVSMLRHES